MKNRQDRDEMEQLLSLREDEGLTYRELAKQSGVPLHTLHYWASKIRRESTAAKGAGPFLPVELADRHPASTIAVEIAPGVRILVEPNFEAEHLARVVGALSPQC